MADVIKDEPCLLQDWHETLIRMAAAIPETQPGRQQLYHYLSFGWLCAGIIEHSTGKKFQDLLEEAFVGPLGIQGEMYIGIPPGVESRLASLTVDIDDISTMSSISDGGGNRPYLPSTFQLKDLAKKVPAISAMFNTLETRRAVIPAANGHCSARALARYYAALVSGGSVPPPHSSASRPPLGSHRHTPQFSAATNQRKKNNGYKQLPTNDDVCVHKNQIFTNEMIRDAFMGTGEYVELAKGDGVFGLGFRRWRDGAHSGFGHSGMGGSTGYCDIGEQLSVAVTVNKVGIGTMVRQMERIICEELGIHYSHDKSLL